MKKNTKIVTALKTTALTMGILFAQLPTYAWADLTVNKTAISPLKDPVITVVGIFAAVIGIIGLFMVIPAVAQWIKNSQNPDAQSQDAPTTRLGIGLVLLVFAGLLGGFADSIVSLVFG